MLFVERYVTDNVTDNINKYMHRAFITVMHQILKTITISKHSESV